MKPGKIKDAELLIQILEERVKEDGFERAVEIYSNGVAEYLEEAFISDEARVLSILYAAGRILAKSIEEGTLSEILLPKIFPVILRKIKEKLSGG